MALSGVRWACSTVAPWLLAAGVLVSITADAGIDASAGFQVAGKSWMAGPGSDSLIPPSDVRLWAVAPRFGAGDAGTLTTARLPAREPEPEAYRHDGGPRADVKPTSAGFPVVDRSRKGDPLVPLRPTLSRRAPEPGSTAFLLGAEPRLFPAAPLSQGLDPLSLDTPQGFEPPNNDEATTPGATGETQSAGQASSQLTAAARASGSTTTGVGSTPTVPRAAALSSATPAPAEAIPLEIAAAPVSPEGLAASRRNSTATITAVPKDEGRPSYASLIDPDNLSREQRCLAEAVYFEARSEPVDGQAAVAQVVLNRVRSGLYPTSVCGVVYQNRHRKFACQFSFACEGKSLRITEQESWQTAVRVARDVTYGQTYLSEVGASTHYHANYVRPFWAKRLKKMDVIGRHIFYKLKPGQT